MKEGCPKAPLIFNQVIDECVMSLYEELRIESGIRLEIFRESSEEIRLPCLLAYADDVVIISTDLDRMEIVFQRLIEKLHA